MYHNLTAWIVMQLLTLASHTLVRVEKQANNVSPLLFADNKNLCSTAFKTVRGQQGLSWALIFRPRKGSVVSISTLKTKCKRDIEDPFSPSSACVVSENELLLLSSVITAAWQELADTNITRTQGPLVDSQTNLLDISSNNSCDQTLLGIKASISSIVNNMRMVASKVYVSKEDYDLSKREAENAMLELTRKIDNLHMDKDQHVSRITSNFTSMLQQLQMRVNELMTQADTLRNINKQKSIEICVLKIKIGEIESAREEFSSLHDSVLKEIVKRSYDANIDNLDNVIKFAKSLPNYLQNAFVCEAVYEEMQLNNHLRNKKLLKLDYLLQKTIEMSDFDNQSQAIQSQLKTLKAKMNENVNIIISNMGRNVRNTQCTEINDVCKNDLNLFSQYASKIVKEAYSNNFENFETSFSFVKGLPSIECSIEGYVALSNEMKSNNDLYSYKFFLFLFKVKETMSMPNYNNVAQSNRNKLISLKDGVPSSVRHLVWGNTRDCRVRNVYHSEHLYVASRWHDYAYGRAVYTWMPGDFDYDAHWKITPNSDGKHFSFFNTYYEKFLYAYKDESLINPYGRFQAGLGNNNEGYYWYLEPRDNDKFALRSVSKNRYLCSDVSNQANRRNVKFFGHVCYDGIWEIKC